MGQTEPALAMREFSLVEKWMEGVVRGYKPDAHTIGTTAERKHLINKISFPGSSAVEQLAVNQLVASSILAWGAIIGDVMNTYKRNYYEIDQAISSHPNAKQIIECLDRLAASSTLERLPGNCISACDILQNMLAFYDIQSKILECQAMVIKENEQIKDFCFVGFTNVDVSNSTVDSHVIVITETNPPVLIDAAIGHLLPKDKQILVRCLDNLDPSIIGKFELDDMLITYHHKKHIKLPSLHQKTLIDRFREEQDLKNKYKNITKILYILIGIGAYNFIANNIMILLKILFP